MDEQNPTTAVDVVALSRRWANMVSDLVVEVTVLRQALAETQASVAALAEAVQEREGEERAVSSEPTT